MLEIDILPSMPTIFKDIVTTFKKKHKRASVKMILAIAISNFSFMITSKRVQYKEYEKLGFPNLYTIIFAPSGCGKDSVTNDLKDFVFTDFKAWFIENAKIYKDKAERKIKDIAEKEFTGAKQEKQKQAYIREQISKIRNMVFEMNNGTAEGFFEEAKVRSIAEFGAMYIKMTEFAKYYINSSPSDKQFFDMFFKAFDGIVQSKSIRGNNREEDITGVPVNCLLMTDISMFQDVRAKKDFKRELDTGFARRSIIVFSMREKYEVNNDIDIILKAEEEFYIEVKIINQKVNEIFKEIKCNEKYIMPYDTLVERTKYKNKLAELANETEDDLLVKEILDRELKVVKLSTIFAICNHKEKIITVEDFKQAKNVVEYLSSDFKVFVNYKPKFNDKHDNLFNFFLENIDKKFSRMEIRNIAKQFGFTQKNFKEDLDNAINFIREIAHESGYHLFEEEHNNNTGMKYWLSRKTRDEDLSHTPLSQIIS